MRLFQSGMIALGLSMSAQSAAQTGEQIIEPVVTLPSMPQAAESCCSIPALTPVVIKLNKVMNSQANRIGETFEFTLAAPIIIGGEILVPEGTAGSGDVVHAAKSRFGGRAGELVLVARYLSYQGVRIPLRSMRFDAAPAKDNSGNAMAAGIIVSPILSFLITGGEVNIPEGTVANAKTAADTFVLRSVETR
jgi:hypothetical protein